MKKIILLVLLALIGISASARKSYIDVYTKRLSYAQMIGEVPKGVADFIYESTAEGAEYVVYDGSPGKLLNILAEYGYEVEMMCPYTENYYTTHYLLSKEIPSGQTAYQGDVNNDGKVNVSDAITLVNMILGVIRDNPNLLEQYGIVIPK